MTFIVNDSVDLSATVNLLVIHPLVLMTTNVVVVLVLVVVVLVPAFRRLDNIQNMFEMTTNFIN